MRRHIILQRLGPTAAILGVAALVGWAPQTAAQQQEAPKPKRPELKLRANPVVGFAPARVVFTAELVGGDPDFEEFYCPKVEWDWDDGTTSEFLADCEPYAKGTSQIRRRYSQEHRFNRAGNFNVAFRMSQGSEVVGFVRIEVRIRGGDVEITTAAPEHP